jgi:hypothetical protein
MVGDIFNDVRRWLWVGIILGRGRYGEGFVKVESC